MRRVVDAPVDFFRAGLRHRLSFAVERPPELRAARPVPPFDKKGASVAEQGVLLDRVSTARVAREAKERLALVRSLVRFLTRRINMGVTIADAALEVNSGHSRSGH